ncbi:unnamed protein product [Darwinula stevensoni]|uniref:Kinesin motor domain-containing protein n=1 Tax=Darwinula stevensoni TaxID=69355 RepID=A0A7R9A2R5_9CRUS|nr:unnamed protein product [Darwinula stevensoni]CAG0886210.1 unnamed protein product [Darwinula stevensoni]
MTSTPVMEERELPAEDNIKVICRFRPLNDTEERIGSKFIVKFSDDNCISIGGKVYVYDKVVKPSATQEQVYNVAARTIVKEAAGFTSPAGIIRSCPRCETGGDDPGYDPAVPREGPRILSLGRGWRGCRAGGMTFSFLGSLESSGSPPMET